MNEYYVFILPTVLSLPIILSFAFYKWVIPTWFDSFKKE